MIETERVCKNPACEHHGALQPIENFYICNKGNGNRKRTCRDCVLKYHAERYQEDKPLRSEGHRWVGDDDTYADLIPMTEGGFVRWAVITLERRIAFGEVSAFNGLSIARNRTGGDQ